MNTFSIKIIAVTTMVIDHIGLFFFPNLIFLRMIGRLSFPLFAWLIANGAHHTHEINKYLKRLFIFAVISQIPFALANKTFWYFNVLFTLFFGLLAIKYIKKSHDKWLWLMVSMLCGVAAMFFNSDYGALGVFSIILFYLFFNNIKYIFISQSAVFIFQFLLQTSFSQIPYLKNQFNYIGPLALLSLIFIALYNGKEGPKTKYLLYAFYPLQYLIVLLIFSLT